MLYSQPQEITGQKTLIVSGDNPVRFKSMQVEKLLNNIDIKSFIDDVVKFTMFHYWHCYSPERFKVTQSGDFTIETPIYFNGDIFAENVQINGLANGVDVNNLLRKLQNMQETKDHLEDYNKLLTFAEKLEKTAKGA